MDQVDPPYILIWEAKHVDSLLIKKLLSIWDEILDSACVLEQVAKCLCSLFPLVGRWMFPTYIFFRKQGVKKSWATTILKSYIQPQHAFTMWLLAQGNCRRYCSLFTTKHACYVTLEKKPSMACSFGAPSAVCYGGGSDSGLRASRMVVWFEGSRKTRGMISRDSDLKDLT